MDKDGMGLARLLLFLAVITLIVAIIFHVLYLVKDRSVLTAQDSFNYANAQLFYLATIALVIGGGVMAKRKSFLP